jgi:hypothetical protein
MRSAPLAKVNGYMVHFLTLVYISLFFVEFNVLQQLLSLIFAPLLSEGTDAVDFMTRLDSGQLDKAFFEKLFGDTAQASNPTDRETIQKTIRASGIPKVNDAMMIPLKSAIENALGVKLETDAVKNDNKSKSR